MQADPNQLPPYIVVIMATVREPLKNSLILMAFE